MLTGEKFCIHLRSFNVRHFGMAEAMGFKIMVSRYDLPAEFHTNLPIGSKVDMGTHTHTHTDTQTGG
jgi:hypothetical protein